MVTSPAPSGVASAPPRFPFHMRHTMSAAEKASPMSIVWASLSLIATASCLNGSLAIGERVAGRPPIVIDGAQAPACCPMVSTPWAMRRMPIVASSAPVFLVVAPLPLFFWRVSFSWLFTPVTRSPDVAVE
eukprot:scaffold77937_cov76-Phaeocystis_antarctica.AAC.1